MPFFFIRIERRISVAKLKKLHNTDMMFTNTSFTTNSSGNI